jgi:hypothetical protein
MRLRRGWLGSLPFGRSRLVSVDAQEEKGSVFFMKNPRLLKRNLQETCWRRYICGATGFSICRRAALA